MGSLGEPRWILGDEMMAYDHVRAWCGGIPQAFGDGREDEIKEILFPENFVNWNGTRLEKFTP